MQKLCIISYDPLQNLCLLFKLVSRMEIQFIFHGFDIGISIHFIIIEKEFTGTIHSLNIIHQTNRLNQYA